MTRFSELPMAVQEDIKGALKAYDRAYVIFENGKYNVSVAIGLKLHYAPDHKVIGEYKAEEIYTKDERMINYIETFHEYPHNYKGKRDYRMLKEIQGDWSIKFRFDDNRNLVIA